jgi:hypothetical protein
MHLAAVLHIFKYCHHKIFSTVVPEVPVCSAKSFTVQRLFSSMHFSVMAAYMSVWTDLKHSLWCMLAFLNVCTSFAAVWYGRPWSSSVWCSYAGYFDARLWWGLLFPCIHAVPLYIFPFVDELANMFACKMHVQFCLYIPIWWYHIHVHSTCFILPFPALPCFWPPELGCNYLWSDPCVWRSAMWGNTFSYLRGNALF